MTRFPPCRRSAAPKERQEFSTHAPGHFSRAGWASPGPRPGSTQAGRQYLRRSLPSSRREYGYSISGHHHRCRKNRACAIAVGCHPGRGEKEYGQPLHEAFLRDRHGSRAPDRRQARLLRPNVPRARTQWHPGARGLRGDCRGLSTCARPGFANLFTDRAAHQRIARRFGHLKVALSTGSGKIMRSNLATSGVMFSLSTASGRRHVSSSRWGSAPIRYCLPPCMCGRWQHARATSRAPNNDIDAAAARPAMRSEP